MKKYIFTAIVFATAALGCTKSNLVELPQSQETPITFEVYNGKTPISKATSIIGATGLADAGGFHFRPWCDSASDGSGNAQRLLPDHCR